MYEHQKIREIDGCEGQVRQEGELIRRTSVLKEQAEQFSSRLERILHTLRGVTAAAPIKNEAGPIRQACMQDYLSRHEQTYSDIMDQMKEVESLIG